MHNSDRQKKDGYLCTLKWKMATGINDHKLIAIYFTSFESGIGHQKVKI